MDDVLRRCIAATYQMGNIGSAAEIEDILVRAMLHDEAARTPFFLARKCDCPTQNRSNVGD
ncbi:hypothetical protein D3C81_2057670 [compost metagenome]